VLGVVDDGVAGPKTLAAVNGYPNQRELFQKLYRVEVEKEVNHIYNWQIILMCLGGVLIGHVGYRIIRKIKT
jgi:hypothetical protein